MAGLSVQVTFLGTSAGTPTAERGLPAVALTRGREVILFDCGEGTQMPCRRGSVRLSRLSRVCVSHLHGDHVLGLPGLLMSLQLARRTAPLAIHGPPGIDEFVRAVLRLLTARIAYPLAITEHVGDDGPIRGPGYRLECRALEHRVPCLGYAYQEDPAPGTLDAAAARRLGVPDGPLMGRLKAGESVSLPGGGMVRPEDVVGAPQPGIRIAYCTDTRPCPGTAALAAGADLLIHEATFASDRADDARTKLHSTAVEAAETALRAGARRLALTHLSPRYEDPAPLLAEAQALFPNTLVAADLLSLAVGP
ncbi:MAG: ribonuclease Z [Armatimonadetes bacterium]|nr:ribonuclease Z [Armatimonadota bacterium]